MTSESSGTMSKQSPPGPGGYSAADSKFSDERCATSNKKKKKKKKTKTTFKL